MFRKWMAVVLLLLMTMSILAVPTFAQGEAVMINCNPYHSDAKGEPLKVFFKNVETGEEIYREISTIGVNRFYDFSAGEYEFVKCTHARNEELEYPLRGEVERLVYTGDEPTVFTFSLGMSANDTKTNQAKGDLAHNDGMAWMLLLAMVSVVTIAIFWLVYAIKGRRNEHKRMIGKFLFHLTFALLGFWIAYFIIDGDMDQFFVCLLAACFPYGMTLAAMFLVPQQDENRPIDLESDPERNSGGVVYILVVAIGAVIGVIAFPIVLIRDIVKIFTSRKYNFKV